MPASTRNTARNRATAKVNETVHDTGGGVPTGEIDLFSEFNSLAVKASQSADTNLQELASAIVNNRRENVERFLDGLERVSNGSVDLALIAESLERRKTQKTKPAYKIETKFEMPVLPASTVLMLGAV